MDDTTGIQQKIEGLANELQEFVLGKTWLTIADEIAARFGFPEEKTSMLENEILFVLIGMDLKKNLQKNLEEGLEIDSGLAGAIAGELEERVFVGIDHLLPTEMEGPEPEALSGGTENLIEDAEGNKDNVIPPLPTATTLEQKLEPLVNNDEKSWEERKKSLADTSVATNRYNGNDPYREPVN